MYTSQAPHVVAPFFLVRRLRDYDPSTDTYLHAALLALGPILLKRTAFPQPAMSTMTFAFHDPHNLSTLTPCLQNPPSITAPPSLHNPAFPANSWGLAPATFSPAQYGPPAGFHHGDETHGLPFNMHFRSPDASSLVFGTYAPLLPLSTILRHDTYQSVFGKHI